MATYGPPMSKKMKRQKRRKSIKSKVSGLKSKVTEALGRRKLKKMAKKGQVSTAKGTKVKSASYTKAATKRKKAAMPGMEKVGKVSRGAKSAVHTKGGTYVKYKKDSKAAGSFRAAFKSNCSGGKSGSFTWQGRSYSCAKK